MQSLFSILAQFGTGNESRIRNELTSEYVYWGGIGFVLLVSLFFLRYGLRAMVNRRVRSVSAASMGFMDLKQMKEKGLITEEELKVMRQKVAGQELERMEEATASKEAQKMMSLVALDPTKAAELALADRKSTEETEGPESDSAEPGAKEAGTVETAKPGPAPPSSELSDLQSRIDEKRRRAMELESVVPGDPLSDPRLADFKPPPPRKSSAAEDGKIRDLDKLLQKGLISQEEYERLSSLLDS